MKEYPMSWFVMILGALALVGAFVAGWFACIEPVGDYATRFGGLAFVSGLVGVGLIIAGGIMREEQVG